MKQDGTGQILLFYQSALVSAILLSQHLFCVFRAYNGRFPLMGNCNLSSSLNMRDVNCFKSVLAYLLLS